MKRIENETLQLAGWVAKAGRCDWFGDNWTCAADGNRFCRIIELLPSLCP
jgi:hypothetical protein